MFDDAEIRCKEIVKVVLCDVIKEYTRHNESKMQVEMSESGIHLCNIKVGRITCINTLNTHILLFSTNKHKNGITQINKTKSFYHLKMKERARSAIC